MPRHSEWKLSDEKCLCGAPLLTREVSEQVAQSPTPARMDVEKRCMYSDCDSTMNGGCGMTSVVCQSFGSETIRIHLTPSSGQVDSSA